MKKALAFLLTVILILGVGNSFAYDQEITFQGIAWGSTQEEWAASLEEIYGDKLKGVEGLGTTHFVDFKTKNKKLASSLTQIDTSASVARISDTIGGYDVEGIYFYSVFAEGDESRNSSSTLLYQVTASLLVNNPKKAEKDLLDKLSVLYGKKSQVIKNVGDFKLSLHYWLGEDNTFVLMGRRPPFEGNELILVWYGKMIDPEEFRKQFGSSVMPTPELHKEANPSDYNGL